MNARVRSLVDPAWISCGRLEWFSECICLL